jgi:AcrR family transcriptional regulator
MLPVRTLGWFSSARSQRRRLIVLNYSFCVPSESPVKQRLLELAVEVLNETGEPGIRVTELAKAGGVSIPTLYHHFGSREGLIEEAQAERFTRALREDAELLIGLLKQCKTKKDLKNVLSRVFDSRRTASRSIIRWQRLNALGATYARPVLVERIVKNHDDIITQVALALLPFQRKGVIRQDIDLVAVIAFYNGVVMGKNLIEIGDSVVSIDEWENIVDESMMNILFGE